MFVSFVNVKTLEIQGFPLQLYSVCRACDTKTYYNPRDYIDMLDMDAHLAHKHEPGCKEVLIN